MKLVSSDIKRIVEEEEGFERKFKLVGVSEQIVDSEGLEFHFRCAYYKEGRRCEEDWYITYTDLGFDSCEGLFQDEKNHTFTTSAPLGNRFLYAKYYD